MNAHASLGMHKIFDRFDIAGKVYAFVNAVDVAFTGTKNLIKTWTQRSAGRNQLARMDYRMLRDIGLEPYQAQAEVNKPFWKA